MLWKKKLLHTISPQTNLQLYCQNNPLICKTSRKQAQFAVFNTTFFPFFHPSWDSQTLGTSGVLFTSAGSVHHTALVVSTRFKHLEKNASPRFGVRFLKNEG